MSSLSFTPAGASRTTRRRRLAQAVAVALGASLLVAMPTGDAAATIIDDGKVIPLPADDAGPQQVVWAGDNTGLDPSSHQVSIQSNWRDVRYTVVGASGSRAGENQKVLGGLGAIVTGSVPEGITTLTYGWGIRGGAGSGDRAVGGSHSPGEPAGLGGNQWNSDFYTGGGGGGASYLGWRLTTTSAWAFLAIAGGGGGAAGGNNHAKCPGARGGNAGQQGAEGPSWTDGAPGFQVTHCQYAAGGRAGTAFSEPQPGRATGSSAEYAPGSGGGGGGYLAGEGGDSVAGRSNFGAATGGGGGGGGGGSSYVRGDSGATIGVAPESMRGDGRVILDYYEAHELVLNAWIDPGQSYTSGYPHRMDFELEVPGNAPADEINLDGMVTATLNGVPLRSATTGALITGTIASGMPLVLPPSTGTPHELCATYTPASTKLMTAQKCFTIPIAHTQLSTSLVLPSGFFVDPLIPECQGPCTLVPAKAEGPWLYPRVTRVDGVDLGGEAPLDPTDISLQWIDLTTNTSGVQVLSAALATEPGPVIGGQPEKRLPPLADSWQYSFLTFRPDGGAPRVGHIYRITATWADRGMFRFRPSTPVTVVIIPNGTTLSGEIAGGATRAVGPFTLSVATAGIPEPRLPLCCGNFSFFIPPSPVDGTFTAELTRSGDPDVVIATRSASGGTASWSSWPQLVAGDYRITVNFESAEPEWLDETRTFNLTLTKADTVTDVWVTPSSAQYGTTRQVTAQVSAPDALIDDVPSGTVSFVLDRPGGDLDLGSAAVGADGRASVLIDDALATLILPGSDDVNATYSGDASYAVSSSSSPLTTTPEPPVITSGDRTTFTVGVHGGFDVTTTGVPDAAISIIGSLPTGMTFVDHGDGTGELSGTTNDYGSRTIYIVASNDADTSTDAIQAFYLTVAVPEVPLPADGPPASSGTLTGVPVATHPGQIIEVTGTGFAPNAPVTFGIYSQPQLLGSAEANLLGEVTITLTIPLALGSHTITAAGMTPSLSPHYLTAGTLITLPVELLAATGPTALPLALLVAVLLSLGVAGTRWGRRMEELADHQASVEPPLPR